MSQVIFDFFNHPFFIIVGGGLTLIAVAGGVITLILFFKGIIPVWFRLGSALSRRKIAIFSDDRYNELREVLTSSGIFKDKNIEKIDRNSLDKAEAFSLYIVDYTAFKNEMPDILRLKKDTKALVVYAKPQEISHDMMVAIDQKRNSIIVNFRGRLLNDVLSTMITSSFR
jgi:hypothetical protein